MEQETKVQAPELATAKVASQGNSTVYQVSKGVILGLIVFGVILITAIYVGLSGVPAGSMADMQIQEAQTPVAPKTPAPDQATEALKVQGTSDSVADIERDITATDLSSLDDIDKI